MDQNQELTCPMCGAKVNSPQEMEQHTKDAHGGEKSGEGHNHEESEEHEH